MKNNREFYMEGDVLFVKGFSPEYGCIISCEVTPQDPLYEEGTREIRRKEAQEQEKITFQDIEGHFELIT